MPENPSSAPIGGALEQLIAGVDEDRAQPEAAPPYAVRAPPQAPVASPDLCLDCAHLLLWQVAFARDARVLFLDPRGRYNLQVFCWPARFGNAPHLHETWNVSAVLTGSLQVFRSAISEEHCLASRPLAADAGEAGCLVPPQYHCLRNAGEDTAITFHVFSMDGRREAAPHLESSSIADERLGDDGILALARLAERHRSARSVEIVRTAFAAAGDLAKLELVKLMVRLDTLAAIDMARALARHVGGRDGDRLLDLVERIGAAVSRGAC